MDGTATPNHATTCMDDKGQSLSTTLYIIYVQVLFGPLLLKLMLLLINLSK